MNIVSREQFLSIYTNAYDNSEAIRNACTNPSEMCECEYYILDDDNLAGCGVTSQGELVCLFSLAKGKGTSVVEYAVGMGARLLDCFAWLTPYYERFGFTTTRTEPNWTEGEPNIHYMEIV